MCSVNGVDVQAQDPQQRLVLSTSYKALAAAGHDQGTLQGAPMSIFVALSNQDTEPSPVSSSTRELPGTGVSAALAANRISFALGLRGTSATIDTACSSSLTSIQAAAESLQRPSRRAGPACRRRLRESVAAGCELLLGPNSVLLRSSASMLSPTGRCQTFNATADGYVRGEGSGAILLTLGEDPSWAGSQVMLCASTTNQDGRSTSLTAPNGQAQQEVLLDALWMAAVPAAAVSFVECHGTGTALGDPIEVGALRRVLGAHKEEKLWLAAGKSNMGHLEAAAGLAGLAKAMCCLLHRAVPPNLHFASLNPHIELDKSCLAVPCGVALSQTFTALVNLKQSLQF
ncbi:Phenolphthiocerol/phthiocerol polyketide synthase subunit C ((Phenol)carboxyphthiodiolenone synthase subunit C) (Beta-ketoacyl-acyl-carrier-protein synthase I) (Phthiocerol synthesis polyketide synthase type I PpsC) [Durusdinium trenchii]|uniref:Ketosynthase family 3 (KS3) domain-containing protein n=1 Tax=Durusdinium trenchii TaxID=1381693 RepID=A0ABP0KH24_9DINO